MTRFVVFLGLLAGVLTGAAIILFNPFVGSAQLENLNGGEYHSYASDDVYGMHQSVDGLLNVAWLKRGTGDFAELSIRNANAAVLVLRDDSGVPVAFATHLSSALRNDNLLLGEVGARSYWNVFWPNYGSIYMQATETRRPMIRDGVISFLTGGELRATGDAYAVTADTADNRIAGVSGALSETTGRYSEVVLSPGTADDVWQGELTIQLNR